MGHQVGDLSSATSEDVNGHTNLNRLSSRERERNRVDNAGHHNSNNDMSNENEADGTASNENEGIEMGVSGLTIATASATTSASANANVNNNSHNASSNSRSTRRVGSSSTSSSSSSSSHRATTARSKSSSNISSSAYHQQQQLRKQGNNPTVTATTNRTHSFDIRPRPMANSTRYDSDSFLAYNDYKNKAANNCKNSNNSHTSLNRGPIGWNSVETKGGIAPCQRSLHTAAVANGCLYIFGGYDGQSRINDFHCYSFSEKTWSPVIPSNPQNAPSPRDRHVSVVYQNSLFIFGGFDGTSRVNDFYQFDFNTMSWNTIHPAHGSIPPSPRHSHSAVVYKDSLYVFGGYDGSYRSDFHEFNFRTRVWTVIPSNGRQPHAHHAAPRARYRATCVVHEPSHCMLLFGGHDGSRHLADTHMFDFENKVWLNLHTEGVHPIPRDSHVSVIFQDSMYIFGGSTGSAMNDLHELKLTLEENTKTLKGAKWSPVVGSTNFGAPGHRFCHVAAVYGSSIYIFGGYDGLNRLNDFIKFNFGVEDLTCDVPESTLLSDLKSFVDNESMSDITIIVEDQPIFAHKLMLTRCPYFHAMFMGEMMESSQNTIRLEEVRYPIILSILEYLYTDRVDISLEDAMELFVAADQFCIPRLKTMCEKKMLESITIDSAANLFYLADVHSANCLKAKTLQFILAHFESVSKTPTFEEMARGNVELVFDILRNR